MHDAGNAAHAPAVGAATITPIALFTSINAVVYSTVRFSTPAFSNVLFSIAAANLPD